MDYGELRANFMDLLNRTDCSEALADLFIGFGVRRVSRVLRTPLQETSVSLTIDAQFDGGVFIPADYLSTVSLRVNGKPLRRVTEYQADEYIGEDAYYIVNSEFRFTPALEVDDVLELAYYRSWPDYGGDPAWVYGYTLVISDLIIYSAMTYACTHFTDSRLSDMRDMVSELTLEVQSMADIEAMSGGLQISNPYAGIA